MDNPYDETLFVQTGEAGREQRGRPGSVLPYAIASLVASFLWRYGFGSLFGIGFGTIALFQLPRGAAGGRVAKYLARAGILIGILGLGLAVWVGRETLA